MSGIREFRTGSVSVSGKLSFTGKVGGEKATVALLQDGETKYNIDAAYAAEGNTYTLQNVAPEPIPSESPSSAI